MKYSGATNARDAREFYAREAWRTRTARKSAGKGSASASPGAPRERLVEDQVWCEIYSKQIVWKHSTSSQQHKSREAGAGVLKLAALTQKPKPYNVATGSTSQFLYQN